MPVEKVNGSLGVTIRGGLPENSASSADLVLNSRSLDALPLVVTHVRPGGAAYNTSRIKPGDRLLKVDHVSTTTILEAKMLFVLFPKGKTMCYKHLTVFTLWHIIL